MTATDIPRYVKCTSCSTLNRAEADRCYKCGTAIDPNAPGVSSITVAKSRPGGRTTAESFGWALFYFGMISMLLSTNMGTTVESGASLAPGGSMETSYTHNIGLLSEKLISVIASAAVWVVGAVLIVAGRLGELSRRLART